jgi:hypothetical protein
MYDEIARHINQSVERRCKIAMFHYQVLINADELLNEDPVHFCRAVGVPVSYAIEYRKMIRLSRLMKQMGATINQA